MAHLTAPPYFATLGAMQKLHTMACCCTRTLALAGMDGRRCC